MMPRRKHNPLSTTVRRSSMKPEYDFVNGERNRFYRPDATHEFPVYLESDVRDGLDRLALERGVEIQDQR